MGNTTPSANMNLPVPSVGVDPSPSWANDLNSCLALIDSHTHVSGSGVQITPAGLNINSDLLLNTNNLTLCRSIRYQAQTALFSAGSDIGTTYVKGVDLYYRDLNGVNIAITSSGGVAGTPGSIANLNSPATASYVAANSTFVFQSDASTSANLDCASILLRNLVASSNALTLNPPNAMGANYSLVLPSIPAQTNVMTLDSSGNMGSVTFDAVGQTMTSTGANAIAASMTSTGANAIAASMNSTGTNSIITTMGASGANSIAANRTRATGSSTEGIGGIAFSGNTGNGANYTSASYVAVTNLSVTLTTSGRPVYVTLIGQGASGSAASYVQIAYPNSGAAVATHLAFFNGVTNITGQGFGAALPNCITPFPPGSFNTIDTTVAGTPGTYTYTVQVRTFNGTISFFWIALMAYEI